MTAPSGELSSSAITITQAEAHILSSAAFFCNGTTGQTHQSFHYFSPFLLSPPPVSLSGAVVGVAPLRAGQGWAGPTRAHYLRSTLSSRQAEASSQPRLSRQPEARPDQARPTQAVFRGQRWVEDVKRTPRSAGNVNERTWQRRRRAALHARCVSTGVRQPSHTKSVTSRSLLL